jgi:hypothetical protein
VNSVTPTGGPVPRFLRLHWPSAEESGGTHVRPPRPEWDRVGNGRPALQLLPPARRGGHAAGVGRHVPRPALQALVPGVLPRPPRRRGQLPGDRQRRRHPPVHRGHRGLRGQRRSGRSRPACSSCR